MPRPCAVEFHAHCYKKESQNSSDATALRRGVSRSLLQKRIAELIRCHGLAPWSFTLTALVLSTRPSAENVRLHGTRPWHPQNPSYLFVAASVRLHGTRPWHPQ